MEDVEIARSTELEKINVIAEKIGICEEELVTYGKYKAKVSLEILDRLKAKKTGKLI